MTSTIVWRSCETDPPDADLTVLVFDPSPSADEPVWLGWKDAEEWFWADGSTIEKPTLWADIPYPDEARTCSKEPLPNPLGKSKA